jgi:regulatory protein|tara:strand:- start:464 stop:1024 length:561 start_codon:yes stop_codon:yes gene_type:complete
MNPTLNKSDFEDLTTNLKDLAYSYLEKYNPSKQQLKVYLLKKYLLKIKGSKSKKEVTAIIDEIILNLEKNKILNDEMYSDSKARMFLKRGYSLNKINQSLRNKGIDEKYVKQSIDKIKEDQIEPDFVSALKLCKRRRIGPIRPESNRELFYKKDMGILARGGFSFDLSKRVLDLDTNEFNKLIKLV